MSVGNLTVEAEFRFDTEGRLVDFNAERYHVGEGEAALTPWRTPLTGHAQFDGVEVPVEGSAIWGLEAGDLEYIRLQITDLRFEQPILPNR